MKATILILLSALIAGAVSAAVPKRPTANRYSTLSTNSPFTSKPVVEGKVEAPNPMENYALGGVSRLNGGYYVILFNKKKAGEKVVIRPGASDNEFEVKQVKWSKDNWKETKVVLRSGNKEGTVGFDEKLLAVKVQKPKPTAAKKPPAKATPRPTNVRQPSRPPGTRTPRPRVVVPPKK